MRGLFIDILQNRTMSLTERMLYLGIVIQRLQKADWEDFDPDGWIEQTVLPSEADKVKGVAAKIEGNRNMYLMQNLKVLDAIPNGKRAKYTEH